MEKPKHTPGNWYVATEYPYGKSCVVFYPEPNSAAELIATCNTNDAPITIEEREANARLMAAAPDLLRVALKMKSLIEALNSDEISEAVRKDLNHAHRQLEMAIAKAEGKK